MVLAGRDSQLNLTEALLMYRSSDGTAVYATTHPIQTETNNPERKILGAGTPLTKDGLAAFAQAVGAATSFAGFVPDNLLYTSPNMIAWWVPESIRRCWFNSTQNKFIGKQVADVAHPAMVFIITPGDWFVFALKESARPGPDTKLQHSPHFNVWDGGRICTGNVDLPETIDASAIRQYEDAFFRSNFTHPNRAGAVNYKGGITMLWRSQIKTADMAKMRGALRSSGKTLRQTIEKITNRTIEIN
ncbi:PRTRC system protein B [Duganella sp. CT11-25]|uniref:PRTRC system protein B n=1 Tax=unclassified Duganella TaxID=2636909 RepID=UPI0039AF7647